MQKSRHEPPESELSIEELIDEIFAKPGSHLETAIVLTDRYTVQWQQAIEAVTKLYAAQSDPEATKYERNIARKQASYLLEVAANTQNFVDWHLKLNARQEKIKRVEAAVGRLLNLRGLFPKSYNSTAGSH